MSSYYTGYRDLDDKLVNLYERQVNLEGEITKNKFNYSSKAFKFLQDELRQVHSDITDLLNIGKERDDDEVNERGIRE